MQGYCDVYKWTILKLTLPEVKCLHPTSSRREMCTLSVSNVIYHKFSHGAAFYTLNGKHHIVTSCLLSWTKTPFQNRIYSVSLRKEYDSWEPNYFIEELTDIKTENREENGTRRAWLSLFYFFFIFHFGAITKNEILRIMVLLSILTTNHMN